MLRGKVADDCSLIITDDRRCARGCLRRAGCLHVSEKHVSVGGERPEQISKRTALGVSTISSKDAVRRADEPACGRVFEDD